MLCRLFSIVQIKTLFATAGSSINLKQFCNLVKVIGFRSKMTEMKITLALSFCHSLTKFGSI